jgi:vancomycin resistance protein VanJ
LVAVIGDSGADIVGLQELTVAQADAIERHLVEPYPHRVLFGQGIPGKGLLSTFPIADVEQIDLYPARPDLRAVVRAGDRDLVVVVAHPPPRNYRKGFPVDQATIAQITGLITLATSGQPTIMVGDFNAVRRSATYARLAAAGLVDAFRAAGGRGGATLPARLARVSLKPVVRVDYIWHTAHLSTLECWIGPECGSDHLPVLARIRFQEEHPMPDAPEIEAKSR